MTLDERLDADSLDLIELFDEAGVEFMIVGGHALAANGYPRATQDVDLWVRASPDNAKRVVAALRTFGAPLTSHNVTDEDFAREGTVYQMGLPPRRIDVLTQISGVTFDEAWPERITATLRGRDTAFLGRNALLKNKRATGRTKDLADVEMLEAVASVKSGA